MLVAVFITLGSLLVLDFANFNEVENVDYEQTFVD